MLAAGIFAASAAEATIDFSQQGWSNEFEITASTPIGDSGISVAFAKGEGKNTSKYYTSGKAVRMYSGNTMTLAVPQGTAVTSIAMKLASQTYAKILFSHLSTSKTPKKNGRNSASFL